MNIDYIYKKFSDINTVIFSCLDLGIDCREPILILLYSSIDALSWLYSDQMKLENRRVKKDYEKWVETFLLPNLSEYDCSANEVYLARCSIIHTRSAVAKHQHQHRIFAYAIGPLENMQQSNKSLPILEQISGHRYLVVHVAHLVNAFILGTNQFFDQIRADERLMRQIIIKADQYYSPLEFKIK